MPAPGSLVGVVGVAHVASGNITAAFGQTPTAGNTLICLVVDHAGTAATSVPTRTVSATYTLMGTGITNSLTADKQAGGAYIAVAIGGGSDVAPVFTVTNGGGGSTALMFELYGSTQTVDAVAVKASVATATASATRTTGGLTPTAANDLLISFLMMTSGATAGTTPSYTWGNGFTTLYNEPITNQISVSVGVQVVSSNSAVTPSCTFTVTGGTALGTMMNAFAVTLMSIFTGSSALAGSGALTFGGTPGETGASSLSGVGTLSFGGTPGETATVDLAGSGTLTFGGTPGETGGSSLAGAGTLSFGGSPAGTGTVALSGPGTLTFGGSPSTSGATDLSGVGTLGFGGTVALLGTVTLAGDGSLSFTGGTPGLVANATLAGAGTLTFGGTPSMAGGAALAGSGTLTFTSSITTSGAVALAGLGTLSFGGSPSFGTTLALSGAGTLTEGGAPSFAGGATLAGAGTLTASGRTAITGATSALTGAGTLSFIGFAGFGIILSGAGTLSFGGSPRLAGGASLNGVGALTLAGSFRTSDTVVLAGAGTLTIGGVSHRSGHLYFAGSGTLRLVGYPTYDGLSFVTVTGVFTRAVDDSGITRVPRVGTVTLTADTPQRRVRAEALVPPQTIAIGPIVKSLDGAGSIGDVLIVDPASVTPDDFTYTASFSFDDEYDDPTPFSFAPSGETAVDLTTVPHVPAYAGTTT